MVNIRGNKEMDIVKNVAQIRIEGGHVRFYTDEGWEKEEFDFEDGYSINIQTFGDTKIRQMQRVDETFNKWFFVDFGNWDNEVRFCYVFNESIRRVCGISIEVNNPAPIGG
jgi:hypothetical protein